MVEYWHWVSGEEDAEKMGDGFVIMVGHGDENHNVLLIGNDSDVELQDLVLKVCFGVIGCI